MSVTGRQVGGRSVTERKAGLMGFIDRHTEDRSVTERERLVGETSTGETEVVQIEKGWKEDCYRETGLREECYRKKQA